jgi:hypothetical protein
MTDVLEYMDLLFQCLKILMGKEDEAVMIQF